MTREVDEEQNTAHRITLGTITMAVRSAKELTVYVKAYQLAMEIFEATKQFPHEER